jgi:hypothetical protein
MKKRFLLYLYCLLFLIKYNFSLQENSIFNKKSFSSYLNDSIDVLTPSALLTGLGYISAYFITKSVKMIMPKHKHIKINKNIISGVYGLCMLPGITIFLRSGLCNFVNVFTRTKGFNPYDKENVLKLDLKLPNQKNILSKYSKTLFIGTHGSGGFPNWGISENLKNQIENKDKKVFFIQKSEYDNVLFFNWKGNLSDKVMELSGKNLAENIIEIVKENGYEKVVFVCHSNGGRVILNTINELQNKNNTIPVDFFTFSTPMTNNTTLNLNKFLSNKNNKWIGSFAPSDSIAQKDPFAGANSILNFGTGVNDQRYINKYGIPENVASFMFWLKNNSPNSLTEFNHNDYVYEYGIFYNHTYYISIDYGFFTFYDQVMSNFKKYSGKRNASVILV